VAAAFEDMVRTQGPRNRTCLPGAAVGTRIPTNGGLEMALECETGIVHDTDNPRERHIQTHHKQSLRTVRKNIAEHMPNVMEEDHARNTCVAVAAPGTCGADPLGPSRHGSLRAGPGGTYHGMNSSDGVELNDSRGILRRHRVGSESSEGKTVGSRAWADGQSGRRGSPLLGSRRVWKGDSRGQLRNCSCVLRYNECVLVCATWMATSAREIDGRQRPGRHRCASSRRALVGHVPCLGVLCGWRVVLRGRLGHAWARPA
jgi:hypothetical protein